MYSHQHAGLSRQFPGPGGGATVQYCNTVQYRNKQDEILGMRLIEGVAIAFASSHEIAQTLGMSVATDPRGQ